MTSVSPVESLPALPDPASAASLNRNCACRTLNTERLRRQLEAEPASEGLAEEIARSRPHLFSSTAVFISPEQLRQMGAIIEAVESVVKLPAYRRRVLARAPAIAQHEVAPLGAFMGFDFHLGPEGPQLIEINTNAGGALLNGALARAQQACCAEMERLVRAPEDLAHLDQEFFQMFVAEWRLQRGDAPLRRIAIVDDDPTAQYLYPEFQLFERLFHRFGVTAAIADAKELEWRDGRLWHAGQPIDLVYNRLTDFYFDEPHHHAVRTAYEARAVVMTPHPLAHALYADKRNLMELSDGSVLTALGVPEATRRVLLDGIPRTEPVTADKADDLWARRRTLFFKPASGFGSRAAYRGDKLTRRVWEEILAGNYVAQAIAAPSERITSVEATDTAVKATGLKLDVRAYVYAGMIQLIAARLYAGQTTNFRTPGGGFAPVFVTSE